MNHNLDSARYLNLATSRRNGESVATPVWFAAEAGGLYVFSAGQAGKVKRIRHSPQVRVAPCDVRGRLLGHWQDARAHLVDDAEECARGYAALRRKYGWQMALLDFFSRLGGRIGQRQLIRIELS
ncbi:PPOX class F420-dependent oxidoreductase [Denitratisoma sp. DHT3]|uniref:PPOX class F420-dependent oxidoreductase n=1 Tax=Denitratisoma sp. DHT3 TaxID=1981880 RepID=UPI0016477AEB|nr:PPOX class F420-dependent oxidoreductase [Denitratisoma sp. DHT3]